jgi:hypothetical protein
MPEAVARVVDSMRGFPGTWCLCGGWGVDAWLGRQTREHKDVDIVVLLDDVDAVHEHFDGWQLLAHDENDPDSERQWDRRRLQPPAHIHARHDGIDLDIQVTAREGGDWVVHHNPRVVIDARHAFAPSFLGLATLSPEVILFFKALERRPQDEADLLALRPHLDEQQARWLEKALATVDSSLPKLFGA